MTSDFSLHDAVWPPVQPTAGESALAGVRSGRLRVQHERPAQRRGALRLVRRFDASRAAVFAAWIDAELAGRWLFATAGRPMETATIDACAGGRFRLTERRSGRSVVHHGRYFEVEPPDRIAFVLHSPDFGATAAVGIDIAPRRRGCALTLIHASPAAADMPRARQRWLGLLYGLGCTLELATTDPGFSASSTERSPA